MKLFIRTKLAPYMQEQIKEERCPCVKCSTSGCKESSVSHLTIPNEDGVLDLSKYVGSVGSIYLNRDSGLLSIRKLTNKLNPEIFPHVKIIDLSECELHDQDCVYVWKLVKKMPNCSRVLLQNNLFEGAGSNHTLVDPFLKEILHAPNIKILDICDNLIVGLDRNDFFQSLTVEDFSKLIWIPWHMVDGDGWCKLANASQIEAIRTFHQQYYQE